MKTKIPFHLKHAALLLFLFLIALPTALLAQGTAITYQGSLNDGANRASGVYDLQFSIYDAGTGNGFVAGPITNSAISISNGLFTVTLDFGPGVFTGPPRWLEISARSNGIVPFNKLTPRQSLTATPYAITASNLTGTLPASQLSGALSSSQLSGSYNGAVTFSSSLNHFIGDGGGLSGVNAVALNGLTAANFWQTGGNSNIIAGLNYLGTSDSNAFELRVNNDRGLRVEPDPRNLQTPNLIAGYGGNSVLQPGSGGNSIAGGGYPGGPNIISSNSAGNFIGVGSANTIGANVFDSVIAGGQANVNLMSDSVIGGGTGNVVSTNLTSGYAPVYSVIGGGQNNLAAGGWSVIAGGYFNTNRALVGFIGAGDYNTANGAYSVVGGGVYNEAGGAGSVVGGGGYDGSSVLGNHADGDASVIGGGVGNTITFSSPESIIAGGLQNTILSNNYYSVISGGWLNVLQTNSAYSVIAGGDQNTIAGGGGVISGGENNHIAPNAYYSSIGGGDHNQIGNNAQNSAIGGGTANTISNNAVYAVIGGGIQNTVGDIYSTVPGGYNNVALGSYSFAAGRQAKALNFGTFIWADSAGTDFTSTAPNQFLIRANGGVGINKNNPSTALDVSGTVTAFAFNSTGVGFSGSGSGLTGLSASQLTGGTLPSSALSGTYSSILTFNNAANSFTGNGSGLTSVNASLLGGKASTSFWSTTGNAGTTAVANYIGTSDGQNLQLRGGFVGINRSGPVTGAEYFGVDCAINNTYGGMYINTTGAAGWPFYGYSQGGAAVAYHYIDGGDANKWKLVNGGNTRLTVTTTGNVGIGNSAPTNLLMVLNARCDGSTWINASDRNLKENFAPIDPDQILTKVAALPLNQWNYKSDASHPHLGPVAQDFYAQFSLGADDKSIATVDESGVALAAIQGLNHKMEEQAAELKEKDTRIAALEKAVDELRTLVMSGK